MRDVDTAHVQTLSEVLDRLPPITVHRSTHTVVDGRHRIEAFRKAGREYIPAVFFDGDRAEAFLLGVKANITHGKPLTLSERRSAVRIVLEEFADRSDRWISETCGLAHSTVSKLRAEVNSGAGPDSSSTRIGRDGRRRRRAVQPSPDEGTGPPGTEIDASSGTRAIDYPNRETEASSVGEIDAGSISEIDARVRGGAYYVDVSPLGLGGVTSELPSAPRRQIASPAHTTPSANSVSQAALDGLDGLSGDVALRSSQDAGIIEWLARTAIEPGDLDHFAGAVPIGRLYVVADECRRRAKAWQAMADLLERRARTPAWTTG
jgi:hypothetical protein